MSAQTPKIVGYTSCTRCGDPWVLKIIAARTGGMCPDKCWLEMRGVTDLQVEVDGRTIEVARTQTRRHPPKNLTPRRRERIKLRDKARLAAMRRLVDQFPVEFADLLAEERGRLGLDPWTIDAALQARLQEANRS
jgi:hypothetical protein